MESSGGVRGTDLRFLGALIGSLAFCLLTDVRAWAATVSHSNSLSPLVYTAALGEANQLTISETGSGFLLADSGAPVTAGTGCSSVDLHTALCPIGEGVSRLEIDLRDKDDTVEFPSPTDTGAYFATIYTRNGNDRVFGCRPEPFISLGRGADQVSLCPTYQSVVLGGPGPDVLRAAHGLLIFAGGEGNDVLVGGTEPDHLRGGPGRDVLLGRRGRDLLEGKEGPDTLRGGRGRDTLNGGKGNDTLRSWDRQRDQLYGGRGFDRAIWDGLDSVTAVERFG